MKRQGGGVCSVTATTDASGRKRHLTRRQKKAAAKLKRPPAPTASALDVIPEGDDNGCEDSDAVEHAATISNVSNPYNFKPKIINRIQAFKLKTCRQTRNNEI